MKKLIYICILCSTLIVLTGCTQNNQNSDKNYENAKVNYVSDNTNTQNNKDVNSSNNSSTPTNEIVSEFTTKIYDKNVGRMNNLQIASKKLSGLTVKSGETFSFNDKMGPYNKAQGFEKAKIFSSSGNVLEEYGGGICQISTTLYNALLPLNVEVIERHKHSKRVQYIQSGKDATLSYGRLDFKFKNTTDYTMEFICTVTDNEVRIKVKKNI